MSQSKPLVKWNKHYQKNCDSILKTKVRRAWVSNIQMVLAIFDMFKGQQIDYFKQLIQSNNIQFVVAPVNCSDQLQHMD